MSSRQRLHLEPAHLLRLQPYGDSSLLLEAFTRQHGRVGLVAKGARGPKSKLRGILQPLQALLLSWNQSGELGTLTGAEASALSPALAGERVFYAWYLNELLLKLLARNDPHPELYDAYVEALSELAGAAAEAALRVFEKRLLASIGYGLSLPQDLRPEQGYDYHPDTGLVPSTRAGAARGSSLLALREERLSDPRALADVRKLLRAALARQLGGQALETPKLLRELRDRIDGEA